MKKIKFFNGISATFALAAVALATTFTSCEKEDFNVNFEPNPAKVVFTPNVIDAETGSSVTAQITITGTGVEGLEIVSKKTDKSLDAGEVTVTAVANGVTGSVKVSYPAVAAGQIISISPVIFLSADLEFAPEESSAVNVGQPKVRYGNAIAGEGTLDHAGKVWNTNKSDYAVEFPAKWDLTDTAVKGGATTKAIVNVPAVINVKNANEKTLKVGAWCMYNAIYTIQPANLKYKVTSKVSGEETEVVYYNPIYTVTVAADQMAIPGHEHAFGHGHGHGDNPNAGGGISLAD